MCLTNQVMFWPNQRTEKCWRYQLPCKTDLKCDWLKKQSQCLEFKVNYRHILGVMQPEPRETHQINCWELGFDTVYKRMSMLLMVFRCCEPLHFKTYLICNENHDENIYLISYLDSMTEYFTGDKYLCKNAQYIAECYTEFVSFHHLRLLHSFQNGGHLDCPCVSAKLRRDKKYDVRV